MDLGFMTNVRIAQYAYSEQDFVYKEAKEVAELEWVKYINKNYENCAFTDENNQRWIVDYKLTHADPSETVDIQQLSLTYQPQLKRYQKALEALEGVKVRCALYFPIYPQWIEVN